jgi:hypothetical protein
MEFEEQRRRQRVVGFRVRVDDAQLFLVDDLDARHRDAELNRLNDRICRSRH